MTKDLRKRHLQIWIAWAFIFPVAIVVAWSSIKKEVEQPFLQHGAALPVIIKQWEKENYRASLQTDKSGSNYQLEWINKKTLIYPTATIYWGNVSHFSIEQSILVGRIEATGNYFFPLDSNFRQNLSPVSQLILYDFIHQQIIDTLKLYP